MEAPRSGRRPRRSREVTHLGASLVGAPVGTVKGRMRLGLAKMRMALGDPAEVLP